MTREYLTSPRPPGPGPVAGTILAVAGGVAGVVLVLMKAVVYFLGGIVLGVILILLLARLFGSGDSRRR